MKDIITNEIYGAKYCKRIDEKLWRYETIPNAMKVLYEHFSPESVIDLGCANGVHLKAFRDLGVEVTFGIEGTDHWSGYLSESKVKHTIMDLRIPITHPFKQFDLVLSLEVLEHLEEKYAIQAVVNILSFGKVFCISACPIGGGHYHVNPQPRQYWVDIFESLGAKYQKKESEYLQNQFKQVHCSGWFKESLKIFRK